MATTSKNLFKGTASNKHLQAAWIKYGYQNFQFSVIELVGETKLRLVEDSYIKSTRCYDHDIGYNNLPFANPENSKFLNVVKMSVCNKLRFSLGLPRSYKLTPEQKLRRYIKRNGSNFIPKVIKQNYPNLTEQEQITLNHKLLMEKFLEEDVDTTDISYIFKEAEDLLFKTVVFLSNKDKDHTIKTKKQLREEYQTKRVENLNPEDKISLNRDGKPVKATCGLTVAGRQKLIDMHKGKRLSMETRKKISEKRKGQKWTPEMKLEASKRRRGENNANCKVTRELVFEIYQKLQTGLTPRQVHEQYNNIGLSDIYKIRKGTHWAFRND